MTFQIIAFVVLILFYGVYLGKMYLQKSKGIKTNQIATKDKSGGLYITELIMKLSTYGIICIEVISIVFNTYYNSAPLRIGGIILSFVGVGIFSIAVYTMQDNWRAGISKSDKTELVSTGIYKLSRNPAFLGFYLVYIGVLMMFFNWILFAFTILTITMLHFQILQEETHLTVIFGSEYTKYKLKVNRYFGRKRN